MQDNRAIVKKLPADIICTILLNLAEESIKDVCSARMASSVFNDPAANSRFVRSVDLVPLNYPPNRTPGLAAFNASCQDACNPSATYLRGLSEFFIHRNLENGLSLVQEAANSGYTMAQYAFDMLRLSLTVDCFGNLNHLCNISREVCISMRKKMAGLPNHGIIFRLHHDWSYTRSFLSVRAIWACPCAKIVDGIIWWEKEIKSEDMCDKCFWSLEAARFCRIIPQMVFEWPTLATPTPSNQRSLYNLYNGIC